MFIEIYHLSILKNRDFLFELNEFLYLTLYVYIINNVIRIIFLRNDFNISI